MYVEYATSLRNFGIGNSFSNVSPNKGVYLCDYAINRNLTLKKINAPYIITGALYISSSNTATLTIEAGTIIKMGFKARIYLAEGGKLVAVGTPDNRISITGLIDQKGYWDYICFSSQAADGNILEYCDIINGGSQTSD